MAAAQARHPPLCAVAPHVLNRPLPQRHTVVHLHAPIRWFAYWWPPPMPDIFTVEARGGTVKRTRHELDRGACGFFKTLPPASEPESEAMMADEIAPRDRRRDDFKRRNCQRASV